MRALREVLCGWWVWWRTRSYNKLPEYQFVKAYGFLPNGYIRGLRAEDVCDPECVRVEVRYRHKGQKYRHIMTSSRVWPPEQRCKPVFRAGVVRATLVPKGSGESRDVTARIRKYAGPHKDIQGLVQHDPTELFPWEDPDELRDTYARLAIVDSFGRRWDADF